MVEQKVEDQSSASRLVGSCVQRRTPLRAIGRAPRSRVLLEVAAGVAAPSKRSAANERRPARCRDRRYAARLIPGRLPAYKGGANFLPQLADTPVGDTKPIAELAARRQLGARGRSQQVDDDRSSNVLLLREGELAKTTDNAHQLEVINGRHRDSHGRRP